MNLNFSISKNEMLDIITDTSRFMFHISLVHILTCALGGDEELFGTKTFKTLFVTAMAIIIYYVLFKKIIDEKLNNAKSKHKTDSNTITE